LTRPHTLGTIGTVHSYGIVTRPTRHPSRERTATAAPLRALTARQQQILDWIRSHLEATGLPPTRAEIAAGLGFSTPSSAEDHLQALARKGVIELLPGASRGLRLRDLPGVPQQGTLPLVGRVAAGQPMLAVENVEARYRVDPALFSPRADYLLRVRGESMRDAGIRDRDLLAVHRTSEARSGAIVVARIGHAGGDEVTVKRFRRRGHSVVLQPENEAFEPIVVDPRVTPFAIEGVAVGIIRSGGW
jgi:repressor LexA